MRCLTYFLVFVLLSRGSRLVCRRFARPWFHISNKRDKRQLGAHWKFPRHVCSAAAKRERVVGNVATTADSRVPFPGLSTESGVLYLNCNNLLEWRSPRKRMPGCCRLPRGSGVRTATKARARLRGLPLLSLVPRAVPCFPGATRLVLARAVYRALCDRC